MALSPVQEGVQRLVEPFFRRGAVKVFVGKCCGRVFAGLEAPRRCRTCQKTPESVTIESVEEVPGISLLSS
jgi:rubrerythrin